VKEASSWKILFAAHYGPGPGLRIGAAHTWAIWVSTSLASTVDLSSPRPTRRAGTCDAAATGESCAGEEDHEDGARQ
jgi:hypothetical protein